MGRPAQIPSEEIYNKIKEATYDIPQKEKESLENYAKRICKYTQISTISDKNMSRVLRSSNYEEYKKLLYAEAHYKQEKIEEHEPDDLLALVKRIDSKISRLEARIAKIEAKLDQSEVKILAVANEDKLTRWDTLHDEIKKNNDKEAYN